MKSKARMVIKAKGNINKGKAKTIKPQIQGIKADVQKEKE